MNNIIKNLENMLDDTTEEFNLDNLLLESNDEVGGNPLSKLKKKAKKAIKSAKKKAKAVVADAKKAVVEAADAVAMKAQSTVSEATEKVVEAVEPTPSDTVVEKTETTALSNDMMDKIKKARDLLNEIIDSNKTERKYIKIDNITTYKINYN
jgi:hypothetical protein